jgi:type III secretion protein J
MRNFLCAAFAVVTLTGCETVIEESLSEEQANAVVVALDEQGIGATKARSEGGASGATYRIAVGNDDVSRALSVLRSAELPRALDPGLATVFGEPGLVPTATEERARYTAALGGDISRSIESIDGILDARVHIALPDTRDLALDEEAPHPRASVMIKYRGAQAPYDVQAVRSLVAGAVQGLRVEDVAVVGVAAHALGPQRASLVHVGPVAVSRGSAMAFKAILGTALALDVILAAVLILLIMRKRASSADTDAPVASG